MTSYTDYYTPDSTAVDWVAYDANTQQLTVFPKVHNTAYDVPTGYVYGNVKPETFEEFKTAPSAGRYFRNVQQFNGPAVARVSPSEMTAVDDLSSVVKAEETTVALTFALDKAAEDYYEIEVFFTIGDNPDVKSYTIEATEVDVAVDTVISVAKSFDIEVNVTKATVYFD